MTVGKRKIGSDIGIVHPREIRKIRIRPLLESLMSGNGNMRDQHLVHIWTLLEAYAKFRDMSLYPLTQDRFFLPGAHFVSYCIDRYAILSLACEGDPMQDTLLWIDPGLWLASSGAENKESGSSLLMAGDTHVRA